MRRRARRRGGDERAASGRAGVAARRLARRAQKWKPVLREKARFNDNLIIGRDSGIAPDDLAGVQPRRDAITGASSPSSARSASGGVSTVSRNNPSHLAIAAAATELPTLLVPLRPISRN